jgi:hypothetical protein
MAKEHRRIEDIMNNSADRTKLNNSIDEYVKLLDSIKDKKESMKVIVDDIKEKIDIDPKLFKVLAGITQKNNAVEKLKEAESLENAIEMMFTISNDDGSDDGSND